MRKTLLLAVCGLVASFYAETHASEPYKLKSEIAVRWGWADNQNWWHDYYNYDFDCSVEYE